MKDQIEEYESLNDKEKIKRKKEVTDLFLGCLEFQLEKEYADPKNLDLLEKAKIITIKRL